MALKPEKMVLKQDSWQASLEKGAAGEASLYTTTLFFSYIKRVEHAGSKEKVGPECTQIESSSIWWLLVMSSLGVEFVTFTSCTWWLPINAYS
jgi:hypothetical protein